MEQVILVDSNDAMLGVMAKMEAHERAVLHRAFSVFIFNKEGHMLLQQRAAGKYHSGGLWSNACCSHPRPGEDTAAAANRRLAEEMGFTTTLRKAFDFIYQAQLDNGLTEYEFDHVFIGVYDGNIAPDEHEVSNYQYVPLHQIEQRMQHEPDTFTAWFHIAFPKVMDWQRNGGMTE